MEITDVLAGCYHSYQVSLTFREGSREPFKPVSSEKTNSIYTDTNITNHVGMLTDLKISQFGKSVGLSSLAANLVGLSPKSVLGSSIPSIPTTSNEVVITGKRKEPKSIQYLFEERNQVQITWGYKENEQERRTVRVYIKLVQSFFPENDNPTVVITCLSPTMMFDQITPETAVSFRTQSPAGADPIKGPLFTYNDMTTKEVIESVCSKTGLKSIISDDLINPKTDKYHTKTWPLGKTFNQFLKGMAKEVNAYYLAFVDKNTGENVIAFISRTDFEKTPIFSNPDLFYYRKNGSILKSVNITADFGGDTGNMLVGVDHQGKEVKRGAIDATITRRLFDASSSINSDPSGHNSPIGIAELSSKIAQQTKGNISVCEASPEADDPQCMQESTYSFEACRQNKIALDFTSLGHSHLRPGVVKFGGIGDRYTGHYTILSVIHTIDTNGYNCRGNAISWTLKDSLGVSPDNAPVGKEESGAVNIGMFKSSLTTIADPSKISNTIKQSSDISETAIDKLNKKILN
jgi:hypothetical protein